MTYYFKKQSEESTEVYVHILHSFPNFLESGLYTVKAAASDQYIHEAYRIVADGVGTLFHDASSREK